MKKQITGILLLLLIFCASTKAQRRADFGIFGGTTSYLGDINPLIPFHSPSYVFGGIYRLNLTERYAIRGNLFYANLKDSDPENLYPQFNQGSFNTSLIDLAIQFEFNFFEYLPTEKKNAFTPYVSLGVGSGTIISSTNAESLTFFMIPVGTGIKYNLNDRVSLGTEWSVRKTFTDNIDGFTTLTNNQEASSIANNDWYSFLGIFITYKFFKFAEKCPAYLNY